MHGHRRLCLPTSPGAALFDRLNGASAPPARAVVVGQRGSRGGARAVLASCAPVLASCVPILASCARGWLGVRRGAMAHSCHRHQPPIGRVDLDLGILGSATESPTNHQPQPPLLIIIIIHDSKRLNTCELPPPPPQNWSWRSVCRTWGFRVYVSIALCRSAHGLTQPVTPSHLFRALPPCISTGNEARHLKRFVHISSAARRGTPLTLANGAGGDLRELR